MHKFFKITGLTLIIFLAGSWSLFAGGGYLEIDTDQVKRLMEKDKNAILIFPLSKIEYDNLHIDGSIHIEMRDFKLDLPADKNTNLIFYCLGEKCTASWRSAEIAVNEGYRHVFAYRAGLPAWVKAGYPTKSLKKLPDANVKNITPDEVSVQTLKDDNFILLDCSLDSDILQIDNPKRVYIPLEDLHTRYKELPNNKNIAVICLTGTRSATAVRFLMSKGYSSVVSVEGGIMKWASEKKPMAKKNK